MTTFHSSRSPVGGTPSHGAACVAETSASSQTPCGPITMSVRSKRMSGNAVRSSRVEAGRALVALPAMAGLHELVDAVGRERRDETRQVARVLGDRVRLVELADLRVELRRHLAPVDLEHGRVGHAREPTIARSWTSTSSFSARRRRCRPLSARRQRSFCAAAARGCSSTAPRHAATASALDRRPPRPRGDLLDALPRGPFPRVARDAEDLRAARTR